MTENRGRGDISVARWGGKSGADLGRSRPIREAPCSAPSVPSRRVAKFPPGRTRAENRPRAPFRPGYGPDLVGRGHGDRRRTRTCAAAYARLALPTCCIEHDLKDSSQSQSAGRPRRLSCATAAIPVDHARRSLVRRAPAPRHGERSVAPHISARGPRRRPTTRRRAVPDREGTRFRPREDPSAALPMYPCPLDHVRSAHGCRRLPPDVSRREGPAHVHMPARPCSQEHVHSGMSVRTGSPARAGRTAALSCGSASPGPRRSARGRARGRWWSPASRRACGRAPRPAPRRTA